MATVTFILPGIARRPVGGYKVVYQYANHLVGRGYNVHLLHMRMAHLRRESRTRRLGAAVRYAVQRRSRPRWISLAPEIRVRNYPFLNERRVPASDVLVATSVGTAGLVRRLSDSTTRGAYLIQHFEDFSMPPEKVLETWRYPLNRIVVSRWLQALAEIHGLETTLVENGVDTERFGPGPPILSRTPGVLAMVSEQEFKRTDLVVQAFNTLADSDPSLRLRTFGASARPAGLHPRVLHQQDPSPSALTALYQETQIFVCTSDFEGFGLPALEAMACGTAVISTDNGGVPSFAGNVAVVVERDDARLIAVATRTLLDAPDELTRRSLAALARAQELSLPAAAKRFEAALVS